MVLGGLEVYLGERAVDLGERAVDLGEVAVAKIAEKETHLNDGVEQLLSLAARLGHAAPLGPRVIVRVM